MNRFVRKTSMPLALAAFAFAMALPARATNFPETTDFSNDPSNPTPLGPLSTGDNFLSGLINSYGPPVGPHGELTVQDMDYVTFSVPPGDVLSKFVVGTGTSIETMPRSDLLFLGLAAGQLVSVDAAFDSAAGLLGWTLVSQSEVGTDILPAIGLATYPNFPVPGATTFVPPLGAGNYTLWLYDGDAAANYRFDAVVTAVPEPAVWMLMAAGIGGLVAMRRRSAGRRVVEARSGRSLVPC